MKSKIMENIGFGMWDNPVDLSALHAKNADEENVKLMRGEDVEVKEIDDDNIHICQHTAYMLKVLYAGEVDKKIEEKFLRHIEMHKARLPKGE